MLDVRYLPAAIAKKKKKLKRKAKEDGIYENFGAKEIMELKDKYDQYKRLKDGRRAYNLIDDFDDWCARYNNKGEIK